MKKTAFSRAGFTSLAKLALKRALARECNNEHNRSPINVINHAPPAPISSITQKGNPANNTDATTTTNNAAPHDECSVSTVDFPHGNDIESEETVVAPSRVATPQPSSPLPQSSLPSSTSLASTVVLDSDYSRIIEDLEDDDHGSVGSRKRPREHVARVDSEEEARVWREIQEVDVFPDIEMTPIPGTPTHLDGPVARIESWDCLVGETGSAPFDLSSRDALSSSMTLEDRVAATEHIRRNEEQMFTAGLANDDPDDEYLIPECSMLYQEPTSPTYPSLSAIASAVLGVNPAALYAPGLLDDNSAFSGLFYECDVDIDEVYTSPSKRSKSSDLVASNRCLPTLKDMMANTVVSAKLATILANMPMMRTIRMHNGIPVAQHAFDVHPQSVYA